LFTVFSSARPIHALVSITTTIAARKTRSICNGSWLQLEERVLAEKVALEMEKTGNSAL